MKSPTNNGESIFFTSRSCESSKRWSTGNLWGFIGASTRSGISDISHANTLGYHSEGDPSNTADILLDVKVRSPSFYLIWKWKFTVSAGGQDRRRRLKVKSGLSGTSTRNLRLHFLLVIRGPTGSHHSPRHDGYLISYAPIDPLRLCLTLDPLATHHHVIPSHGTHNILRAATTTPKLGAEAGDSLRVHQMDHTLVSASSLSARPERYSSSQMTLHQRVFLSLIGKTWVICFLSFFPPYLSTAS